MCSERGKGVTAVSLSWLLLSPQRLHWKEADHAPCQLLLSPILKKKCLRGGQQLLEKVLAVASMNARLFLPLPRLPPHPDLAPPEI